MFLRVFTSPATYMVRSLGFCAGSNALLLFAGWSGHDLIDLSRATRLKDIVFWCKTLNPQWITLALQTVTSNHRDLQKIIIHFPFVFTFGETGYREWLDLDRVLVRLSESRSARLEARHNSVMENEKKDVIRCMGCLLPERTKRGFDLVEYFS